MTFSNKRSSPTNLELLPQALLADGFADQDRMVSSDSKSLIVPSRLEGIDRGCWLRVPLNATNLDRLHKAIVQTEQVLSDIAAIRLAQWAWQKQHRVPVNVKNVKSLLS